MNEFTELLVGTFANKRQAQSHPTRYAHIRVSHRLIGENRVYGEQAYNYLLNRPYRQFVIDVVQVGEEYHLRNYEIKNPLQFAQCQRLEEITDDLLTYREGCDIIMRTDRSRILTSVEHLPVNVTSIGMVLIHTSKMR